jgi:hypothetical protein
MAIAELRETFTLLSRTPVLWLPGLAAGLFAAMLWLVFNFSGAFFASRLFIISGLALMLFTTGMIAAIKNNEGELSALLQGGIHYYFRVLLPQLVIVFTILLIFTLIMVTMSLIGTSLDPVLITFITFGIMIPSLVLTYFFDTVAVFEDRGVFDSIRRSIEMTGYHITEVIQYALVSVILTCTIVFCLMMVWEAALFDKLEPLTRYTEAQFAAFTPEQLLAMIGQDGIWITAGVLLLAGIILVPVLYTYKVCFFKSLSHGGIPIQQVAGEYDSKGRWYKY